MNGDDIVRFEEEYFERLAKDFAMKNNDEFSKFVEEQYLEMEIDQADQQYELERERRTEQ